MRLENVDWRNVDVSAAARPVGLGGALDAAGVIAAALGRSWHRSQVRALDPRLATLYDGRRFALVAEEDEAERQQAELYASQQPQPTQPPPQYHYHSQQGQPGQQPPPPQSGRGGAYRPVDAPMDGYPGAERPPRPQPPPQPTPRRRGSDNGGCTIS